MSKRKQHSPEFKAKVALEALKGDVALPLNLRHDAFGDIFCP